MRLHLLGRRARLTSLLLTAVLVACLDRARPPATPKGVLAPELDERSSEKQGPFRVVFASPAGETREGAELGVVFDRPLRALDRADLPPPALTITPPVAGVVRWVGTRALSFSPEKGALPSATDFRVEVPAGTRALDGSTLAAAHVFAFSTPGPSLVGSRPSSGNTGVLLTAPIDLYFNQDVAVESVAQFGKLTAGGRSIPFKPSAPEPAHARLVRVTPLQRLPANSQIVFELAPAFTSKEGPRPAGATLSTSFRTYAPLAIELHCARDADHGPCRPGSSMSLSFNNAVRQGDVRRALSLTPAEPLRWPSFHDDNSMVSYVEIPGRRMSSSHRVKVQKGLRDEFGQALAQDFVADVRFEDPYPRVAIGISDGTLAPVRRQPIPIAAVNAQNAAVVWASLSRADVQRWSETEELTLSDLVLRHRGAERVPLAAPASPSSLVRSLLDPFGRLSQSGLGVLGIAADYRADPRDQDASSAARLAKVSDLALTAKLSSHGSLVWVTRLSSAEPVAGAVVEIGVDGKRRYTTDANGLAQIPSTDYAPRLGYDQSPEEVLFASSGSDWTFERVSDVRPAWDVPVNTDFGGELGIQGLVFTERGVYRPGDTVRVKGVVRREGVRGSVVPKGEKLTLTLTSPNDEKVRTQTLTVSEFGTFHSDVRLPSSAPLGSYLLSAALGKHVVNQSVEVREYQPAEFDVDVELESEKIRGDELEIEARGTYLFGGPMNGATIEYSVIRSTGSFTPPNSEGFSTDAHAYHRDVRQQPIRYGRLRGEKTVLDGQGLLRMKQALKFPDQLYPESVSVEASVTDPARRTISGRAAALVHPGEFYVGVRVPETFVQGGANVKPSVIAVTPDGRRLERKVKLELYERRWTTAREDRGGPHLETVSRPVDKVVGRCELSTTAQGASCALTAERSGYHLVRATSTDARGNKVESATSLYVFGKDEAAFRGRDDGEVELVLDKEHYRVGDKARVLVKSPFQKARALVSVERASVLRHEQRVFSGSMPSFELEVTEDFAPNAFVSVHLVRELPKGAEPAPGAAYRSGYAELRIDPEPRRLSVEVTPSSKRVAPGDEVSVALRVKNRDGKPEPAELTVFAVDEGVLMLTGYALPDPLRLLSQSRGLGVATLETRAALSRIVPRELADLLGMGKGDEGGGGGGDGARSNFRQTAYFDPRVIADANGAAQVRFRLPDSLTTYRVMALAVGGSERYGTGSSSVTARKPLMARPALPRFLRAGDRVEAGVVVSSNELSPGTVTVSARAEGVALEGPAKKTIQLGRDQSAEVRFAFRAERAGVAKFHFEASGGNARDRVELERRVSAPAVLEAVALSGSTEEVAVEGLGSLAGVRPDVGGLEVSLASTALVGLESALGALMEYPYGCTEQLTSRLVPLVPLRDLARDFGVTPSDATQRIGSTIREILGRQQGDGGFAMWPGSRQSSPWVSAYVLSVLAEARARGEEVSPRVFEQGRGYLRRLLSREAGLLDAPTEAYVLDTLAALGHPDAGYMNRLFERRADLPVFGRALLLSAYGRAKLRGEAVATLVRELEASIRVSAGTVRVIENQGDAYERLFDSPIRTQALVLSAILRVRPEHPLLADLSRGLLAARRGGTWRSTQETAHALLALDAYRKVAEPREPDFEATLELGSQTLVTHEFKGRKLTSTSRKLPMSALLGKGSEGLVFEKDGSGTLFYQARLRYARRELPRAGFDSGFYVERRLRRFEPGAPLSASSDAPSESKFEGGDLVVGDLLVVTSSAREFVVLDEPIPAGFEAVDTTMVTASAEQRELDSACLDCDGDSDRSYASTARRELRDDRAVFFVDRMSPGIHRYRYVARATSLGRFVLPPARIEEMYSPETFGRTGAEVIEVR